MDRDDDLNHMADAVPPPYTQGGYGDSKYGFSATTNGANTNGLNHNQGQHMVGNSEAPPYQCNPMTHSPPHSPLYGTVPELPPRGSVTRPAGGVLLPGPPPGRHPGHSLRHNPAQGSRPSAQERLFGPPKDSGSDETATYTARPTSMIIQPTQGQGSLDRHRHPNNPQSSYDGTSSYDYSSASNNGSAVGSCRLPPNAPDDLKVAPPSIKMEPPPPPNPTAMSQSNMTQSPQRNSNSHDHNSLEYRGPENNYRAPEYRSPQTSRPPPMNGNSPHTPMHARGPSLPNVPSNDHAKYSGRTNSASQADYSGRGGAPVPPYKPVPPPKPKHYRPPDNSHHPRNGSMEPPPPTGPPPRVSAPGGTGSFPGAPHYSHQHSLSQPAHRPHNHSNYQQNMYGGQMPPQSPPYSGPPSHHRAINLPHNPHLIDLAGSREQRGSAFELYRKPQHMHNLSSSDAMNSSVERDETFSPKTKKKLSKKPSFIKNAVLDLFRSKTKSSRKVSRQKSLCESDLQQRPHVQQMPVLRREKSDLGDMSVHTRNQLIRNQMLHRSNSSSCEKPVLKPILKRQTSFCDDRDGSICTVRDYDAKPVIKSLRRQNSMYDIETEPKVTPLLRRQNSLIEYNRRGIYGQTSSFNMITKIDPIYQRQQQIKHEPFHPTQPLPPEPLYQSKDHLIYDPIPKPRRTYTSLYDTSSENPYTSRSEMSNQSFENPYGNRHTMDLPLIDLPYASKSECLSESPYATRSEMIRENTYATRTLIVGEINPYASRSEMMRESPYATRSEIIRDNSYATRNEIITESPYTNKQELGKHSDSTCSESPYSSKEYMLRTRLIPDNSYSTKEEMLRHRFSESPYSTKDDLLKQRIDYSKEAVYGQRTYEPPLNTSWSENSYGVRPDRRLQTPVNYAGRVSPMTKCLSEPPYATRTEMMARLGQTDSPYATRAEVKSSCSDSQYTTRSELLEVKRDIRPASAECTYVSKQEILREKAALLAKKESSYSIKLEEKLEIIKQRNQAKKEKIYQTRKEVNESDAAKIREPLYVSKRDLKESVIYESHQETKEVAQPGEQVSDHSSARSSPYELSDANHLSRREPVYQTKTESECGKTDTETFQEIDFSKLRLTDSKTDTEKQNSKNIQSNILKGEPMYAPRLHGKADHISNALKVTSTPIPYESTTSMETQYASECSMNFESKPQSTPYASQDLLEKSSKPSRSVKFCEKIVEKSPETSEDNSQNISNSQNETTIIQNQNTVIASTSEANESENVKSPAVEPDGPHTTWGIFDSEGGVLEDRQWGVSLIIPPKAIAPGIKQKIYFTVSDPRLSQRVGGPPIDMDNGEAMLSPLVMCGPQGLVFLRPVTLRLPHCANAVPSLGLTIKATDTEAHLSTDWDQIHLPATTTLNTVAVKVDHF